MPKIDRRVRRSRRLLREALLTLVVEKPYNNITIQEIAERGDLNRATFYLHYGSKDELLYAALADRFDLLVAKMNEVGMASMLQQGWSIDLILFEHVAEHAPLYKVLLGEQGMGYIIFRILDYIAEAARKNFEFLYRTGSPPDVPIPVMARHVAGSIFGMVSWWVQNDMPYSAETMAKFARIAHENCIPQFDLGQQIEQHQQNQ